VGNSVDVTCAETKLAELWSESGPCGHAYEGFYRENSEKMVSLAIEHLAKVGTPCPLPTWKIQLKTGCVQVVPDFLVKDAKKFPIVIRFRTGRPTSGESEKDIYAIYKTAVEKASSGKGKVKIYYLSTGETEEVNMTDKKLSTRLNRYERAMMDIATGLFPPKIDEWTCPRCPHYFICPAGEMS
jgi:CRISPR/Cas system-associated exonuclease Cas4 (RecB family)